MTARAGATDGGRAGHEGHRPASAVDLERAHDGRRLFVADTNNHVVRVVDLDGAAPVVRTLEING